MTVGPSTIKLEPTMRYLRIKKYLTAAFVAVIVPGGTVYLVYKLLKKRTK